MLAAIRLQILRPKPVPFGFIFLFSLSIVNGVNNFFWSSSLMPQPESFTSIFSVPKCAYLGSFLSETDMTIVP